MKQQKTLIFFHIGRTAGSTLQMIMRRHFPRDAFLHLGAGSDNPKFVDEFKRLPEKRRGEIRYMDGHMPFGLHKYLPYPSTYITLLREPVNRVISGYYYVKQRPGHRLYNEISSKNMSLQDYVCSQVSDDASNYQTCLLSGELWGHLLGGSVQPSNNILETAKTNIREHFLLVGLTERFDESLILLKRALGWKTTDILYLKRNVGRRPPKDEIDSDTLKLIESYNQLDIELYAWAKQVFEERINQQGFLFRRELEIFRLCNKLYGLSKKNRIVNLLMTLAIGEMKFSYLFNRVYSLMLNKITHWIRLITNRDSKAKPAGNNEKSRQAK